MRSSVAIALALAACTHPPGRAPLTPERVLAAEPRPASPTEDWRLDVDAAIAHAYAHGPIAAEHADLEAVAQAQVGAARQLRNPEVRIGRSFDDSALDQPARTSIALRLHPDRPWEVDARVARARAGVRAEQATSEVAKRVVASRIRRAFAQLALADATARLFDSELTVLRERVRVLDEQLGRGAATRLIRALADQDLAEVVAARSAIEVTQLEQRTEIAFLAGIPAGQAWTPVIDAALLSTVRTGLDRRALVARALAERPELAEATARADVADAVVAEERGRRVPWLETLQIERSDRDQVSWAVSATIEIPLLGLDGGRSAAARAERTHRESARTRLAAQTAREVGAAIDLVETTGARAKTLREQLAATSEAIEALLAQERGATSADPVKVLLLEERHLRAQRAVLEAGFAHRAALIALQRLTGAAP